MGLFTDKILPPLTRKCSSGGTGSSQRITTQLLSSTNNEMSLGMGSGSRSTIDDSESNNSNSAGGGNNNNDTSSCGNISTDDSSVGGDNYYRCTCKCGALIIQKNETSRHLHDLSSSSSSSIGTMTTIEATSENIANNYHCRHNSITRNRMPVASAEQFDSQNLQFPTNIIQNQHRQNLISAKKQILCMQRNCIRKFNTKKDDRCCDLNTSGCELKDYQLTTTCGCGSSTPSHLIRQKSPISSSSVQRRSYKNICRCCNCSYCYCTLANSTSTTNKSAATSNHVDHPVAPAATAQVQVDVERIGSEKNQISQQCYNKLQQLMTNKKFSFLRRPRSLDQQQQQQQLSKQKQQLLSEPEPEVERNVVRSRSNMNIFDIEGGGSASMQQLSTSWEFKKLERPAILDIQKTDDDKDELQDVAPPRFIKISDGKISLGPPKISDSSKEKAILEGRIYELENALIRLQDQVNIGQCGSPKLERDLKEQLENMNRAMKFKERKAMLAFRDHKMLQTRFARQEAILQTIQEENKNLQQRVRQYEHCLDDVMRKVVDALVAEDGLREEVSVLKGRVRDLEAQNAALSISPIKGKDEGYCTMSSGQPQPSNSQLEDLPEEPEQWSLLPSIEPCSTTEMEDWSMSQEELIVSTLDDDNNHEHEHDWIWNSNGYINSIMIDSQSEGISQLLQETIVYSDDEEPACTDFTKDFYKLVNIPMSGSTRSLYSHMDAETDDEDDDDDNDEEDVEHTDEFSENGSRICNKKRIKGPSPTPSEAGQALVTSCSSSESENQQINQSESTITPPLPAPSTDTQITSPTTELPFEIEEPPAKLITAVLKSEVQMITINKPTGLNSVWRKSNGWKRVATPLHKKEEPNKKQPSPLRKSKIPPPVPIRRSYVS